MLQYSSATIAGFAARTDRLSAATGMTANVLDGPDWERHVHQYTDGSRHCHLSPGSHEPSSGASEYHRIVTIGNKTIMSGLPAITRMCRFRPATLFRPSDAQQLSGRTAERPKRHRTRRSPLFRPGLRLFLLVFLVYSVKYPDQPLMTAQLTPAIVKLTDGNTTITGTLTTSTGKPVDTTTSTATDKIPQLFWNIQLTRD